MAQITISEVRYTPNSPDVLISWRVEDGLSKGDVRSTTVTQDALQARVTVPNGQWGDDEVLAAVRAAVADLDPGGSHTVTLAPQPPRRYPTPELPPAVDVPATPAEAEAAALVVPVPDVPKPNVPGAPGAPGHP